MKKLIITVLFWPGVCALAMLFVTTDVHAETHLFILSGQSNMSYLNEHASFVPTVSQGLPDDVCVVVKCAVPGAAIDGWVTGDRPYYEDMLAAVAQADCDPDTITLCWMQGESDATPRLAAAYRDKLARLIDDLRSDLDFDAMGVVIGRLNRERYKEWNTVREAQAAVAESDPRGMWIDTDDLVCISDGMHFTRASYEMLGARFAQAAALLAAGKQIDAVIVPGVQEDHEHYEHDSGCFISALR